MGKEKLLQGMLILERVSIEYSLRSYRGYSFYGRQHYGRRDSRYHRRRPETKLKGVRVSLPPTLKVRHCAEQKQQCNVFLQDNLLDAEPFDQLLLPETKDTGKILLRKPLTPPQKCLEVTSLEEADLASGAPRWMDGVKEVARMKLRQMKE